MSTAIAVLVALLLASGAPILGMSGAAAPAGIVFSAAGDFGSWGGLRESLAMLKTSGSDFALALGDLSYGGNTGYANTTEEAWCERFQKDFKNVELIAGNHDTGQPPLGEGNINNFTTYCPFTLKTSITGVYGKQYYFDLPAANPIARFILISPDLIFVVDGGEHYDYSLNSTRYIWTRDAIEGARSAGIPWVIVGMHKNCIGAGEHACETGTDILNLLVQEKVDLILQAHTHNYERSKQLALNAATCPAIEEHIYNPNCVVSNPPDGQYTQGPGSVIVIQGTGGRELDPFNASNPYAPYFAANMGNGTAGAGNGVVTYTVTASHISMRTNFNGTYTDSFQISRTPPVSAFQVLPVVLPIAALASFSIAGVLIWRNRRSKRKPRDSDE